MQAGGREAAREAYVPNRPPRISPRTHTCPRAQVRVVSLASFATLWVALPRARAFAGLSGLMHAAMVRAQHAGHDHGVPACLHRMLRHDSMRTLNP